MFISATDVKNNFGYYLTVLEKEDVIITAHGKPTAVLHHVDGDDLEDYLFENDPAFQRKIEEAWLEYIAVGGSPIEKVIEAMDRPRVGQKR